MSVHANARRSAHVVAAARPHGQGGRKGRVTEVDADAGADAKSASPAVSVRKGSSNASFGLASLFRPHTERHASIFMELVNDAKGS